MVAATSAHGVELYSPVVENKEVFVTIQGTVGRPVIEVEGVLQLCPGPTLQPEGKGATWGAAERFSKPSSDSILSHRSH